MKVKVVKDNAERWLLTYADLMNLLLILFIILYTMSKVDIDKYQQVASSLRNALGESTSATYFNTSGGGNSLISLDAFAPSAVIPAKLEEQQMEEVKEKVSEIIEKENLKGTVDVAVHERGVVISITEQLLFKSGSAEIEPASKEIVEKLGKEVLLSISGNQIRIEGHTDNDPIKTSIYPSNWELSSARATNVLRTLIDKSGIEPKMISAVGYGEFRPKFNNDSTEHKATNRRVDIVIIKNKFVKAEAESVYP